MRLPILAGSVLSAEGKPRPRGACGRVLGLLGLSLCLAASASGMAGSRAAADPLVATFGQPRRLEARLSGGFPYQPRTTSAPSLPPAQLLAALPLIREVEDRAARSPAARDQHDLGRLDLLLGKVPEAVAALQRAAAAAPDAALLSDLAAAQLEAARRQPAPLALAAALTAADGALALDDQLPEAHFNRALALEALALNEAATTAWEAYLQLDPSSGWATEAREHLAALTPAPAESPEERQRHLEELAVAGWTEELQLLVQAEPRAARRQAEALLGRWGEAQLAGEAAPAATALKAAGALAKALRKVSGDALWEDAVAVAEAHLRRGGPGLAAAARGHRAYCRGVELLETLDGRAAAPAELAQAEQDLRAADSPLAFRAALFAGLADYFLSAFRSALVRFEGLYRQFDTGRYPVLAGRLCWLAGLTRGVMGDPLAALRWEQQSERFYAASGEPETLATVRNLVGDTLDQLGDTEGGWRYGFAALQQLPHISRPGPQQAILYVTAERFRRAGELHTALYFQNLRVARAERESPDFRIGALRERARLYGDLGRREEALADLRRAGELVEEIPDQGSRQSTQAELQATEGVLLRRWGAPEAVAVLTEAIEWCLQIDYRYLLVGLYLERARASLQAGDGAAAAADLEAGITELEARRQGMPEASQRVSFFEQSRELFEEMVRLRVEAGEAGRGLEYAERARARSLLELVLRGSETEGSEPAAAAPPTVAAIQEALPADVVLVEYFRLADRWLCWVLDRQRLELHTLRAAAREDLAREVPALQAALRGSASRQELEARLGQLHDILIAPLAGALAGHGTVLVVPDAELYGVPFGALRSRADGRYLIEGQAVVVAPSAAVALASRPRGEGSLRPVPLQSALVVGAPAFDHKLFPLLPELPAAAQEAAEVARLYPQAQQLAGADATRAQLLAALPSAEVLHFAGHAVVNEGDPGLSALLLAPEAEADDSGALYARELQGQRWPRLRLVVLGACRSGFGRVLQGEGVQSLARWFLAAGAQAVVASLWDVDDGAASELLIAFHRFLRAGMTPAVALAEAQRAQLRSADPSQRSPARWAAFELTGGVPDHPR